MKYALNHVNESKSDINLEYSRRVAEYLEPYIANNAARATYTINEEFGRNVYSSISKVLHENKPEITREKIKNVVIGAARYYRRARNNRLLHDEEGDFLDRVNDMYENIWRDHENNSVRLDDWARIKHGPKINGDTDRNAWDAMMDEEKQELVNRGPPTGNDCIILATAARFGQDNKRVGLVTRDSDFIIFAEEIEQNFNVSIVDGFYL